VCGKEVNISLARVFTRMHKQSPRDEVIGIRLFRFDDQVGRSIERFDSHELRLSSIARPTGRVQVGCMHLGANGCVGYHQATVPQLFLVVSGKGWVRGEALDRVPIQEGQASFWEAGEWHAAGTDNGMMAVVLEAEELDPSVFMPETASS
jgi:quercetin dioxygenase-like cupin family protein